MGTNDIFYVFPHIFHKDTRPYSLKHRCAQNSSLLLSFCTDLHCSKNLILHWLNWLFWIEKNKNKTEFHVDNSLTENAHTFDEEFSGTFGNSGRISCSAREYAGVFSQHFSDGKHELVALAQHLIAHDISQQCHTRCSRQLPKVLTVQILTVQILSGHRPHLPSIIHAVFRAGWKPSSSHRRTAQAQVHFRTFVEGHTDWLTDWLTY